MNVCLEFGFAILLFIPYVFAPFVSYSVLSVMVWRKDQVSCPPDLVSIEYRTRNTLNAERAQVYLYRRNRK